MTVKVSSQKSLDSTGDLEFLNIVFYIYSNRITNIQLRP